MSDHSTVTRDEVRDHFDSLALSYDSIKEKNSFYHDTLKQILRQTLPPGKRVLEIGTGTGEMLNAMKPSAGVGIDISSSMIEIAKRKYSEYEFRALPYELFDSKAVFDYIVLVDVIEHLESADELFRKLKTLSSSGTQIILTMANPLWEPILQVLEKLKMKMDEGPHNRISQKQLILSAEASGFELLKLKKFLLYPKNTPVLSWLFNQVLAPLPLLNKLALIEVYNFRLKN